MLRTVLRGSPTRSSPDRSTGRADPPASDGCSIDDALRVHFAPIVRAAGFKGSGRSFWRATDAFALVVNVQGSMGGSKFAVNLGLQPLALLKKEPKRLKEYECEFRQRLSERGTDQWWDYGTSAASTVAAAKAAASVFTAIGKPAFEEQVGLDAPILTISATEFSATKDHFSGFRSNIAQTARTLALLREEQGDMSQAIEFAEIAQREAGQATGLAAEMAELIKRVC